MGDLEEEEEFILLDLDEVCRLCDIAPNMPYTLSGLDTMNPVMVLDGKIKLIGEYQETIGACFVFSENEDKNASENDTFEKQVKPIAQLQKILKFRLFNEVNTESAEVEGKTYDLHESRSTLPAFSESDQSLPSGAEETRTDDQSGSLGEATEDDSEC